MLPTIIELFNRGNIFFWYFFIQSFLIKWKSLIEFIIFNITNFRPGSKFTDNSWISIEPYFIFFQTEVDFQGTIIVESTRVTEFYHKTLEFFKLFVIWWFVNLSQILMIIGDISRSDWLNTAHYLLLRWFYTIFWLAFISNYDFQGRLSHLRLKNILIYINFYWIIWFVFNHRLNL